MFNDLDHKNSDISEHIPFSDEDLSWRDMGNVRKAPNIRYTVQLAALITGKRVKYKDRPVTMADMDWFDAAEAYDNGYTPDNSMGSMWVGRGEEDLSEFWKLLEEYDNNPPIRQINQFKAIEHIEYKIMYYLEESVFDDVGSEYYNRVILPKIEFLRQVRQRTMDNLIKRI